MTPSAEPLTDGTVTLHAHGREDDPEYVRFRVETDGAVAGEVSLLLLEDSEDMVGQLTWSTEPAYRRRGVATRAVRLATSHALTARGLARVQAYVDPADTASLRIASRAGLRREGVMRGARRDLVVFARLADDPEPHDPQGFRALLNAGLPRKRVIAQLAVRDLDGRLLLCQLSYKPDWDLPGGVVEVGESPRLAAEREVHEELGLELRSNGLLAVDWLPPWSGWDDACTLVFDGGVWPSALVEDIVPEPREIRTARFCDTAQIRQRCADFTTRRALAALAASPGRPRYLESGREPDR